MTTETGAPNYKGNDHRDGKADRQFTNVSNPSHLRRTLLAIGFAVLVSMLLAPHGDYYRGQHMRIKGFGPFFITELPMFILPYEHGVRYRRKLSPGESLGNMPPCLGGDSEPDCYEYRGTGNIYDIFDKVADGDKFNPDKYLADKLTIKHCATVKEPAHWEWRSIGTVMIDMLVLQAIFLVTLFAVLVNLRKSWRRNPGERK